MPGKPVADLEIDEALVHLLLREQHADLAHLPLAHVDGGWDNELFRLGDELVVRLPRREAAAQLIEHEQRWLPQLAARLPIPVCACARRRAFRAVSVVDHHTVDLRNTSRPVVEPTRIRRHRSRRFFKFFTCPRLLTRQAIRCAVCRCASVTSACRLVLST
ncbi:MAG: hypothetical protein U0Q11_27055 [Vicinamibacterales bacterium]